jgi:hypothetical protein
LCSCFDLDLVQGVLNLVLLHLVGFDSIWSQSICSWRGVPSSHGEKQIETEKKTEKDTWACGAAGQLRFGLLLSDIRSGGRISVRILPPGW